jgi:hypothetical protein
LHQSHSPLHSVLSLQASVLSPLHSVDTPQFLVSTSVSKSFVRERRLPFSVTMDIASKKAAKKRRLREKRAAAHSPTAADETTTSSTSENLTSAPLQPALPLWDSLSNVRQEAENYFHKQQLRTAPIATYPIVEPTTAANNPVPAHTITCTSAAEDCDTVEKLDTKLLRMQEYWAEFRSGPFPEGIRNSVAELRAVVEKEEADAARVAALLSVQREEREKSEEENQSEKTSETSTKEKSEREEDDKIEGRIEEKEQNEENVANDGATRRKSTPFDWAADVDASVGVCPIVTDDNVPEVSAIPVSVELDNPIPIAPNKSAPTVHVSAVVAPVPDESIDPVPISLVETSAIIPTVSTSPIMRGPRDFSTLRSGKQNPWGSLNHRRRRPYLHTRQSDLSREPPEHSHSRLPPSHHPDSPQRYSFNSQLHPYSHSRHVKPHPSDLRTQSHLPVVLQPPVNIFQIIQHPRGISSTKPKITKNISPGSSVETQGHARVLCCTCGAISPVHEPDRGSWRLMDSRRGRFGRRFSRRSHRRFWDWERGRSHLGGGEWSRDSVPPSGARGPAGSLPGISLSSRACS